MIYLFTALYCEAEIFIKQFHLEKNLENSRFQEFYGEKAGIRLTVTGVGEIAAASAVSSVCTTYKPQEGDILLNIGTCAHLAGNNGVFVCNKIIERATGKTFYPDLLYHHGLREEAIVTGMLPCNRDKGMESETLLCNGNENMELKMPSSNGSGEMLVENLGGNLYDMEAAAVYQAGSYFFGPHQMMFIKVVSDKGMAKKISKEKMKHCMEANQKILFDYMEGLPANIFRNQQKANGLPQGGIPMETLCADLHCSKVMRDSLRQHVHYWELAGSNYASVVQEMYREGMLPCKDKREGKLRFEELKRRLF
ncbi:MAG: hypothetical protein K2J67_06005 [Lachnospiraceae bacterium]|nr:hypothetical protein [Lachnospiraceae bacterium]